MIKLIAVYKGNNHYIIKSSDLATEKEMLNPVNHTVRQGIEEKWISSPCISSLIFEVLRKK